MSPKLLFRNGVGIILTINNNIFYNEEYYQRLVTGENRRFHIPKPRGILGNKNLTVFLYDSGKNGIFAYFTSECLCDNEEDQYYYSSYFKINNFISIDPSNRLNQEILLSLLRTTSDSDKFDGWKNRGQPYLILNSEQVNKIMGALK